MINTLFWEPWDHWEGILDNLIKLGSVNLKVWVSANSRATHHIHDFDRLKFDDHKYYKGNNTKIYKQLYKHLYAYFDMLSRNYIEQSQTHYNLKTIHEYLNLFNITSDYCASILIENEIELLMIARMPHTGADYIMYLTARYLNIPIIMFEQSRFRNLFFYLNRIEDFGFFNDCKPYSNFDFSFKLKDYNWADIKDLSILKDLGLPYLIENDSSGIVEGEVIINTLFEESSINIFQRVNKVFKYISNKQYYANLKIHTTENVDLNVPYVYFPLHYQPELNTSVQGGIFCDQLLAIERLSEIIPNEWNIYIKENPVQQEFMRGEFFFKRLKNIKNKVLLSRKYSTDKLIENCQFVATITGSAGWEAICTGKNVLTFGNPWYANLCGVFNYNNGVRCEEILNYKINKNNLEFQINQLLSKAYPGVVEHISSRNIPNFSVKINAEIVATSITEIINNTLNTYRLPNSFKTENSAQIF
jgi:hypothetical protein